MVYRAFHWISPKNYKSNVIPFPKAKRMPLKPALVQQNSVEKFVKESSQKLTFCEVFYTAFLCVIFGPGIIIKSHSYIS